MNFFLSCESPILSLRLFYSFGLIIPYFVDMKFYAYLTDFSLLSHESQ